VTFVPYSCLPAGAQTGLVELPLGSGNQQRRAATVFWLFRGGWSGVGAYILDHPSLSLAPGARTSPHLHRPGGDPRMQAGAAHVRAVDIEPTRINAAESRVGPTESEVQTDATPLLAPVRAGRRRAARLVCLLRAAMRKVARPLSASRNSGDDVLVGDRLDRGLFPARGFERTRRVRSPGHCRCPIRSTSRGHVVWRLRERYGPDRVPRPLEPHCGYFTVLTSRRSGRERMTSGLAGLECAAVHPRLALPQLWRDGIRWLPAAHLHADHGTPSPSAG